MVDRDADIFKEVVEMLKRDGEYEPSDDTKDKFEKEIKELGVECVYKKRLGTAGLPDSVWREMKSEPQINQDAKSFLKWKELGCMSIEDMLQKVPISNKIERTFGQKKGKTHSGSPAIYIGSLNKN